MKGDRAVYVRDRYWVHVLLNNFRAKIIRPMRFNESTSEQNRVRKPEGAYDVALRITTECLTAIARLSKIVIRFKI
jgi:hypothetical protein